MKVIKSKLLGWAGHVACIGGEHKCMRCFGEEISQLKFQPAFH